MPPDNNPEKLSITAIEYERAASRKIPRLVLISNHKKEHELEVFVQKISDIDKGIWRLKYENTTELILVHGVTDDEQGTREVMQELRLRQPRLIERVVGSQWDIFLNDSGIKYCERICCTHTIRNRIE